MRRSVRVCGTNGASGEEDPEPHACSSIDISTTLVAAPPRTQRRACERAVACSAVIVACVAGYSTAGVSSTTATTSDAYAAKQIAGQRRILEARERESRLRRTSLAAPETRMGEEDGLCAPVWPAEYVVGVTSVGGEGDGRPVRRCLAHGEATHHSEGYEESHHEHHRERERGDDENNW